MDKAVINIGTNTDCAMSQPAVSRIISIVTYVINKHLLNEWIKFPTPNEDIRRCKNSFFEKYNFADTIGAIDGTHVAIKAPPIYPAGPYYNRKGYYMCK